MSASVAVRKRDPQATRERIQRAAAHEFGTHGFAGARIERVVKRSGCNIRLIYHHFGSKAGLYSAVIEGAYAHLRTQEAALDLESGDAWDSLERLLRFTMRYFAQNPEFEGIIRAENESQGRVVAASHSIGETGRALIDRVAAIIARGQACGAFRPGLDPRHLYLTITALARFHLANGYSLSAVLGTDLRDAKWREDWAEHAADLLRRYVEA